MTNLLITILAYFIDRFFGEFKRFRHPVMYIGDMINFYEERYYKDSFINGLGLVIFIVVSIGGVGLVIEEFLSYFISIITVSVSAIIASMFIAYKMLYDSVNAIIDADNKKALIAELVSRDTEDMSESDVYKAAIETYAENLSDGVIAPLFYLLFFGLPGILVYKAINTMDSMVGYKNQRYELFGKAAAVLDDVANYIPSRITAALIMLFGKQQDIFAFYEDGKKHDSPNAGHPITAMALALDIKLGGDTSYFGEVKKKAYFGEGREEITPDDVRRALSLLPK